MTPIEIFEYKLGWLKHSNNTVSFDEFIEYECKRWCREHVSQRRWHFTPYVDWYQHAISFELKEHKQLFEQFLEARRS